MKKKLPKHLPEKLLKIGLTVFILLATNFAGYCQTMQAALPGNFLKYRQIVRKASTPNARIAATVSRPGNSQDFIAISGGGWHHETNSTYTYNSNGVLTQWLITDAATNQNIGREVYAFDAFGNETEYSYQQWQNGAWKIQHGDKYIFTYNPNGDISEIITQDPNNGVWENISKSVLTYNPDGTRQEVVIAAWFNNSWVTFARETYTYTNGLMTQALAQTHNGSTWINDYQLINITWAIPNLQADGYTIQDWRNNAWENTARFAISYPVNGGFVEVKEEFNNNNWEYYSRYADVYDSKNNNIGRISEQWDNVNLAWILDQKDEHTLTYDAADNVTERIIRSAFHQSGGALEDNRRYIYSNFQTFTIAGGNNKKVTPEVKIYPNPAIDFLTIALPDSGKALTVTITELSGKAVLTRYFEAAETKQLQLEVIKPGIYLLHLETNQGKTVRKIVKN